MRLQRLVRPLENHLGSTGYLLGDTARLIEKRTSTMPSTTYQLFRAAVVSKQQITCRYKGLYREICPHVLGLTNDQEQVLSFQFGGLPPSGEWRCMKLDEVTDAAIRNGEWHTGMTHSRPQTCVKDIDVEVDRS
jgi:hypothetical protein